MPRFTIRIIILLALVMAITPAAADSPWPDDTPTGPSDPLARAVMHVATGDTLIWIDQAGSSGRGVAVQLHGTRIQLQDGRQIDARDLTHLWRHTFSRSSSLGKAIAGGVIVGLVGGVTAGNTLSRDNGGLENLGAFILSVGAFGAGVVGGLLVGAAAPPSATWQLLITDDPSARPYPRPPGVDPTPAPRAFRRLSLEVGAEVSTVRWQSRTDNLVRPQVGFWVPLAQNLDGGILVGFGRTPDYGDAEGWSDTPSASIAGTLRAHLSSGPGLRPYLGFGGGVYGHLGDTPGWNLCLGLQNVSGRGTSGRIEAGTIGGIKQIGGDKAALAYLAVRLDLGLGRATGSR